MSPASTITYAGPGLRLLATIVDALLLLFLYGLARFVPVLLDPARYLEPAVTDTATLITYGELAVGLAIAMLVTATFWNRVSGTPGKLLVSIRVVAVPQGSAPGMVQAMVRFAGYALSLLPAGLGFLWSLWDRRHQGFHDKLSRTAVIIDDESTKPLAQLMAEVR